MPPLSRALRFMVVGQTLDLLLLLPVAMRYGIAGEANPVARLLWDTLGPFSLVLLKIVSIWWLILIARLTVLRGARRVAVGIVILGCLLGLAGALSSALALYLLA
jgi:hypothetical protein